MRNRNDQFHNQDKIKLSKNEYKKAMAVNNVLPIKLLEILCAGVL